MRRTKYLTVLIAVALCVGYYIFPKSSLAVVPVVNEKVTIGIGGAQGDANPDERSQMSGDGRYVLFTSNATNLVPNDTNGIADIFIRDRQNNTVSLINITPSGTVSSSSALGAVISYTGRYILFSSKATDLTTDGTSGLANVYLRDTKTGSVTLVSKDKLGIQADGDSSPAAISADGRFAVFTSSADNLDPNYGVLGYKPQIYYKDLVTGSVVMISKTNTNQQLDGIAYGVSMDCAGGVIAFQSNATNVNTLDTNNTLDVFIVKLGWSGSTITEITAGADKASQSPLVSCDGNKVVFETAATTLPSNQEGIYEYDRLSGTNSLVYSIKDGSSYYDISSQVTLSNDGRYIAFATSQSLDSLDTNQGINELWSRDIYVRDMMNGSTDLISRRTSDGAAVGRTSFPWISGDGSYVSYSFWDASTDPSHILTPNDTNGYIDIFVSKTGH